MSKSTLRVGFAHALFALIVVLLMQGLAHADNPDDKKEKLTAAFIYQITKFTQWPSSKFDETNSLFTICLLEKDDSSLIQYLNNLEGNKVKGREIAVRHFTSTEQLLAQRADQCEVLYAKSKIWQGLSAKDIENLAESTLLIGGRKQFLKQGGMLALITVNNKMKIFINPKNVANSSIKLESRLKALAQPL